MPDEEDHGNEHLLEGAEDIMGAIDSVLDGKELQPTDEQKSDIAKTEEVKKPEPTEHQTALETAQGETKAQAEERARNEKGQFTKEQQEAKDKADAEAKGKKESFDDVKSPKSQHYEAVKSQRDAEKQRADAAEEKLKQHEAKIAELESKSGVLAPEVKVLQKENAELKARLEESEKVISYKAVEETKAFKEGVSQPQQEALEVLNQVAETYKIEGRKLDEVLAEPNKFKRLEMLGDLTAELPERSAFVKDELKQAVEKYVAAETTAKQLFQQAKGNRDYAERERMETEAKAALERQEAYQKANKDIEGLFKEKYPEIAGNDEVWKSITEKAFKVADFDKMPPKAKAFCNMSSWAYLEAMKQLRSEREAHEQTKAIMSKRNGSTPSPTTGRDTVTRKDEDDFQEGQDPLAGVLGGIDSILGGQR